MRKQLRRIKNQDSVLGGVTQGLGEYFEIDPTIFKVLFVVLFFTPVPSFIVYVILWVVLPEEDRDYSYSSETPKTSFKTQNFTTMGNHSSKNGNLVGGLVLIVLGSIFAFRTFFDINLFHYIKNMWPLFLIGLGVWIIVRDKDGNDFNSGKKNYDQGTSTTTESTGASEEETF